MDYPKTLVNIQRCTPNMEPENTVVQIMPADGWFLAKPSDEKFWETGNKEKAVRYTEIRKVIAFGVLATGKVVPLYSESDCIEIAHDGEFFLYNEKEQYMEKQYAEGVDVLGIYEY